MRDLLTYIFYRLAQEERARIDEADANPDKWYELSVINEEGSTKTVEKENTFAEVIKNMEQYAAVHKLDCINIHISEDREFPGSIDHLFSTPTLYSIIRDYFRCQNKAEKMRFVGSLSFEEDKPVPKKEYYNYGEEAGIFIDEIAFTCFRHLVCYIPDNGEEESSGDWCTYQDFLDIAEGDTKRAKHLFDEVTWEHPSTLYDQWKGHGTLDEKDDEKIIYSYTGFGDFVRCNNCIKTMLIPIGADMCPACYSEGRLAWMEEEYQEKNRSELNDLEGYKDFKIVVK
jgi:hypothetical protein